ncbi:MAG: hypothetical protein ACP6KW_12565, partial [Candidatus Thorarchaeota archaeon]
LMLAPNVHAFDLDPGGGGNPDVYVLTIRVIGIRLANDGDLFGPGEVYMENPGIEHWTESNAESMEGRTDYSDGYYYGEYYDVPYEVVYQQIITQDNIGEKFVFELKDDDGNRDASLWYGWVKLREVSDCSVTKWIHCNGHFENAGPVKFAGVDGKYTEVGQSIYVWNQLRFKVTITH